MEPGAAQDRSLHGGDDDALRVVCEHADRCAGCPLIGLPYATQLAHKRARLVEALAGYPGTELTFVEPTLPADPVLGYRTRAKLVVAPKDDGAPGLSIGLYASGGGHVVIDTPSCRVISAAIADVAAEVRALACEPGSVLARPSTTVAPGRGAQALVRAIDLREVRFDPPCVLVTWVASRDDVRTPETLEELRVAARTLRARQPRVAGVALNLRESDSPQVLGSEMLVLDGESVVRDRIGTTTHLATFGAFVQAHRGQASRVHDILARGLELQRGQRVLDLYGGSGAIGLSLAAGGADVHLVESFAPAARLALESARTLPEGSGKFEATAGEVSEVLARLGRATAQGQSACDVVVLNPPRRGVAPLVREQVAMLRPRAIGYVSCDPETLARDLDHFVRLGYAPVLVQPLDMIPLTEEVETVTILRQAPIPPPRVAYSDDEIVIVEKGPHEPTTPQGEYSGSLLARVRQLPGCDQAVPVHRLDVGTSGLVIFARKAAFVFAWAEALASQFGRKIYLAAARGRTPSKGAITRELRDEGRVLPARTRYRWLGGAGGHSVLRVIPEHGRTHQIRRHLAAIGHPVLGDERYGHAPTNRFFEEKHGLDRTFLHCIRLELNHPKTGVRLIVETPLPGDLRLTLSRCGGPTVLKFLEGKAALGGSGPSTLPPPPLRDSIPPSSFSSANMPVAINVLDPPDVNTAPVSIRPPIMSGDDDE
ncbi:MAG: RsmD family RNA methyltransferase [Deltaproteobacteria bacterium]|nr:RsmD family RNA methyltransferase [Deltaproteobacteria bacterium]